MVHGGQKMWKIAQNGRKCAHSWLRQMRHMPDLDRSVPYDFVSSNMLPTYLLGVAQTPPVLGMAGSPSEPMIWDRPKLPTWGPRYAKPKGSYSPGPRYGGHRSVYPHNILGS